MCMNSSFLKILKTTNNVFSVSIHYIIVFMNWVLGQGHAKITNKFLYFLETIFTNNHQAQVPITL